MMPFSPRPSDSLVGSPGLPRRRRTMSSGSRRSNPEPFYSRFIRLGSNAQRRALKLYKSLTVLQRIAIILVGLVTIVLGVLGLVYNQQFFHFLSGFAKKWRNLRGGWLILWVMTFVVSFPPLIGYSSCVTLAGLVYGFPHGWFVVATATICGATCAFLLSRYLLHSYVSRLIAHDARFAALALTLKHDGLKLLIMIRFCPLPYSLSNGALSTIPTIHWSSFALATAIVSPKLLLHVFIGAKWGELADSGDKMDAKTKAISYASIAIGILVGTAAAYIIWGQTKKRAAELQELERTEAGSLRAEYADDPDLAEAAEWLREEDDDISLRETWTPGDEYVDSSESARSSEGTTTEDQDASDVADDEEEEEEEESRVPQR